MSQQSLTTKLVQANANMKKLSEFFVARREWAFTPEAKPSILDLAGAVSDVGEEVRTLMARCGANPAGEKTPDVEDLGAGTHDHARLQRFLVFLRDLRVWFAAQIGPPTDSDGIAALREMDSYVACMNTIFRKALKQQAANPSAQPTASEPAVQDVGSSEPPLKKPPVQFGKCPPQLVLDDTESDPMVQEFRGRKELTPECERRADAYLAAWDVELGYYHRKKLLERILRWIMSAPDGQVLVIKMKTIEEPFEPYPSYVSREVLDGKEPPESL
jgi:hypothetical protein